MQTITYYQIISGQICDQDGNVILQANREHGTTPLAPHERDELIANVCAFLNRKPQTTDEIPQMG